MAVVTVDNSNLEDMLVEAGVEPVEATVGDKAADKPAADAKPADKIEAKTEAETEDADDVEDDDGVTTRQKRELSGKMLKAIGKKHRQVKEAEEFAAHQYQEKKISEARASDLERQLQEVQAKANPVKEDIEPAREDFANDSEYMKASIKWGVGQGIQQQKAMEELQERQASVQAQFKRAAELVPDFETATNNLPPLPQGVVAYMRESDMFAELGYHFAKNKGDAAKLVSLSPLKQLVELGRIETTLRPFGSSESSSKADDKSETDGKPSKAAPSTADTGFSPSMARRDAPVIKPLLSGESTQVEPDVREMNTRQMIERYQKDQKVNLHSRKRH